MLQGYVTLTALFSSLTSCFQCDVIAPEFESAAHELQRHGVLFAKVDSRAEEGLTATYGISSFPTLKLFRRGRPYNYNGVMDREGTRVCRPSLAVV